MNVKDRELEIRERRKERLQKDARTQSTSIIDPAFEEVVLTPRHGLEDEQYGPPPTPDYVDKSSAAQERLEYCLAVIVVVAISFSVYFSFWG